MALDPVKLAEIEGMLTDDVLTDDDIVDKLRAAGLPELAHAMDRALREAANVPAQTADLLRAQARSARSRRDDGDSIDGYNIEPSPRTGSYDRGWRDALDSFARHLDRVADRIAPASESDTQP